MDGVTIIVLSIVLLVCILAVAWLFLLYQYHSYEQRLQGIDDQSGKIVEHAANKVPLLYELMQGHIVRKEEVFSKNLKLRRMILDQQGDRADVNLFAKQLDFLFQVAEKHQEVISDKRYDIIKSDIGNDLTKVRQMREEYRAQWEKYHRIRQKSRFILFPGYWWVRPLPPA